MNLATLDLAQLGGLICETLKQKGVRVTLSGGACVQIHCRNEYITGDLDFVIDNVWSENRKIIQQVMTDLGFTRQGRIYVNTSVSYSVEFPPGPIGIGDEYGIHPISMKLETGTLSLLSPTDTVKDRLAGFFYGNDNQCLDQALLICKANEVDMGDIKRWAKNENRLDKFDVFQEAYGK